MNRAWFAVIIPWLSVMIIGVFVLALLLIKLVWPWTIPDLFPGAIDQGLIAREITWYTSFKLAVFMAVMAGIAGIFRGRES